MTENKVKKAISVRFDPDDYSSYSSLVEGAAFSVSDGLRQLVAEKLAEAEKVDMTGFAINCDISWKKPVDAFPEHVGHMLVSITPPSCLSVDLLERLVFVIPEFWTESESSHFEPFRIDSAYFHRVAKDGYARTSAKTSRNVTSFHLIKNCWRVAIFDYGCNCTKEELATQIKDAVSWHITQTVRCYLAGHLPASRVLPKEVHDEMMKYYDERTVTSLMNIESA